MVVSNLGANPLVLQIPIGSEDQFQVCVWGGPESVGGRAVCVCGARSLEGGGCTRYLGGIEKGEEGVAALGAGGGACQAGSSI